MNHRQRQLLLLLADRLASMPPAEQRHFDMERFFVCHLPTPVSRPDEHPALMVKCGTAACALGYAAFQPEFQAAGLRLVHSGAFGWRHHYEPAIEDPDGFLRVGFDAAAYLFDLSRGDVEHLFTNQADAETYPEEEDEGRPLEPRETAQSVARRIRAFVAQQEPTE